jgi:hypothetical protein
MSDLSKYYSVTRSALRHTFKFSRFHGVIGSVHGPALTQQPQLSTVRHELQRDHHHHFTVGIDGGPESKQVQMLS